MRFGTTCWVESGTGGRGRSGRSLADVRQTVEVIVDDHLVGDIRPLGSWWYLVLVSDLALDVTKYELRMDRGVCFGRRVKARRRWLKRGENPE